MLSNLRRHWPKGSALPAGGGETILRLRLVLDMREDGEREMVRFAATCLRAAATYVGTPQETITA